MMEFLLDINIIEMVVLVSLVYVAGWSVLDHASAPWTWKYFSTPNSTTDQRLNENQVPIPFFFLFCFHRRKIPVKKDQQDDDDYYSSPCKLSI